MDRTPLGQLGAEGPALKLAALILAAAAVGGAHVGSPDVFFEGKAGPHRLFVAIRPPAVIPGVAEIEIRAADPGVEQIRITPLPLTGEAAKFPPTADVAQRSKEDPLFFTGSLWMMVTGSWQVRIAAEGPAGKGEFSVPVPAAARRTRTMDFGLGAILAVLGLVLAVGAVSIVTAAVREAPLAPGSEPDAEQLSKSRRVSAITAALVVAVLYLGNQWWNAEARNYDRIIYKPLQMKASVESGRLSLRLSDPGWIRTRLLDDFIPDHGHLMHLFVAALPNMDRVWHLHPDQAEPGRFTHQLPEMPAGRYQLWADIVHGSGFPETMSAEVDLPAIAGKPLEGDDSVSQPPSDGYRIRWVNQGERHRVRQMQLFRFVVEDAAGQPARDLELYMGMPGHAVFVRKDRSVFAHVHPGGSVPMAALGLTREMQVNPHAMHAMTGVVPPEIVFPYGFPNAGDYRVIVQVKRKGRVETAMFDAPVSE